MYVKCEDQPLKSEDFKLRFRRLDPYLGFEWRGRGAWPGEEAVVSKT